MDIFSNLMAIGECLLDIRRTHTFQKAINETVKRGDVVLDVGTGSGILAMFAAKAGAKKVYALEITPDVASFARQNIIANKLQNIIEVVNIDVKNVSPLPPINVVTMELMDTGLVSEQQAVAFNALHKKKIINSNTRLIPYCYQCAVALINYDFNFYGFRMPFVIQARNFAVRKHIIQTLSPTLVYKEADFSHPVDTLVDQLVRLSVVKSGNANAVLLKSKAFLTPKINLWGTTDMNMPIVIPLPKPIKVLKNQTVEMKLKYSMGEGFSKFDLSAKLVS